MKKRSIAILTSLLMITSLAVTGCGGSGENVDDSGEVYKMKIANLAAENDPLNIGYRWFADLIAERTDGRITVEIFANKAISNSDDEQAEMIRGDMIQMCSTPSYTLAAMNSDLKNFYIFDLPYMFRTDEEIWAFGDSEMGMDMRAEILEISGGIRAYGPFPIGWVKASSNVKEIKTPEDLAGLKIRTTTSEFYMGTMAAFGANPTPVAYGEVYTALQQGTVDGMMTATSLYASDRFYEVQKYMGAVNPFAITHYPIISDKFYTSLPEDLKVIFDETMLEYVDYMRNAEFQAEIDAIKLLRDEGMIVTEYSPEEKQPFIDAALPLWDEKAALVGGKEMIDATNAFLEDYRASN